MFKRLLNVCTRVFIEENRAFTPMVIGNSGPLFFQLLLKSIPVCLDPVLHDLIMLQPVHRTGNLHQGLARSARGKRFRVSLLPAPIGAGYDLRLHYLPLEYSRVTVSLIMLNRKEQVNPALTLLQRHLEKMEMQVSGPEKAKRKKKKD